HGLAVGPSAGRRAPADALRTWPRGAPPCSGVGRRFCVMPSKAEQLSELKRMLKDVFEARAEGSSYARLARAHGYVDGYMRALLESGQVSKGELLALVAEQRARVAGPATRTVVLDDADELTNARPSCEIAAA